MAETLSVQDMLPNKFEPKKKNGKSINLDEQEVMHWEVLYLNPRVQTQYLLC